MLVWARREPWILGAEYYTDSEFTKKFGDAKTLNRDAPDGRRRLEFSVNSLLNSSAIVDNQSKSKDEWLYELGNRYDYGDGVRQIAFAFLDDDRCVSIEISNVLPASTQGGGAPVGRYRIWHRRYPEWWWGHLYRPEVWALVVVMMVLVAQVVREWKRRAKVAVPAG